MKKSNKLLLLLTLVVMLAVTIIIPVKSFAASVTHLPGKKGQGPFGDTCWCPEENEDLVNCGCAVSEQ